MVERITSDNTPPEIPNYRLIKRIGSGAFGEVWLAEEILTRIYRAVKIIRGRGTSKQRVELDGVRQYQQRSHGHPHLVQVLTVGETPDCLYYVMEGADNALGSRVASPEDYEPCTLASILSREGQLSLSTALEHTAAILEGVDHLHRNGLMHRDLKPGNILLVDGSLKLGDIGLATHGEAGSAGTPGYRTPEGTADDLYATGVILYEMVTGQPPSKFPELPEDLERSQERDKLRETLHVIDRACDPHPDRRFESAQNLQDAIRKVAKTGPVTTRWSMVLPTVVIGVIAVVGIARLLPQDAEQPRNQAPVPEWGDVLIADVPRGECIPFPRESCPDRNWFRVDEANMGGTSDLYLSGAFKLHYCGHPGELVGVFLATDDEIVHLIYFDKLDKDVYEQHIDNRRFQLRNEVLNRLAGGKRCPVYIVLAFTDNVLKYIADYPTLSKDPGWTEGPRILIGYLQTRISPG